MKKQNYFDKYDTEQLMKYGTATKREQSKILSNGLLDRILKIIEIIRKRYIFSIDNDLYDTDVLLHVLKAFPKYYNSNKGSGYSFLSWIIKMHFYDIQYKIKRKIIMVEEQDNSNNNDLVTHQPNILTIKELHKLVLELPKQYKRIANLRFIHEMKYKEISKRTGLGFITVKGRIHRARKLLLKNF